MSEVKEIKIRKKTPEEITDELFELGYKNIMLNKKVKELKEKLDTLEQWIKMQIDFLKPPIKLTNDIMSERSIMIRTYENVLEKISESSDKDDK